MPKRRRQHTDGDNQDEGELFAQKSKNYASKVSAFHKSFKRPTSADCLKAVGRVPKCEEIHFKPKDEHLYYPIPSPTTVDDWLAHVHEEGQTYNQFKKECPWISGRKVKLWKSDFCASGDSILSRYPSGKVYVLPIKTTKEQHMMDMSSLTEYASTFLSIPVHLLQSVSLLLPQRKGDDAFIDMTSLQSESSDSKLMQRSSSRLQLKKKKVQYRMQEGHTQLNVVSLINILKSHIPEDALCLVGLTMEDLYEESSDLFVAGLAAGNSRVAVFSFARYDPDVRFSPEYWYQIEKQSRPSNENTSQILKHGCKLLVHEICHLFGFDHCIWYQCCMNGSGHIQEDFSQPMFLCPVDLRKLCSLSGFDIVARYKKLYDFFNVRGYEDECRWLTKRLAQIQGTEHV